MGPHVHGQATVNVSVEGVQVEVEAILPGHDVVGFERAPATMAENKAVAAAIGVLRSGSWLIPAKAAGCRVNRVTVEAPDPEVRALDGHADYVARGWLTCHDMGQLDGIDIGLPKAFPSVHEMVVDVITASGSTRQTLDAPAVHVDLSP
ncbi:DUF2796 domain-containing protein [Luteibacter aegosomatis]|uniref:ZrgA family zinc uptake protein n=1 Tax=Luteibacter aegosomatis TaxID=2911537 RepID=UPI001FFB6717|nr:DUF2796 domain-containing protein [Luteibacter aegosomatis]UPG84507.1 DUF2796 domain-containing protein [Luteibacter aegosomatis]